jgi:hypothetical protein
VIVTGWSDGPIPWPRCRALGTRGGGSGLLLDEVLARAVRNESVAAICHHWKVHSGVVWRWRKALGVGWTDSEGTRRLMRAAAKAGARVIRERPFTAAERDQRRQQAVELDLGRHLRTGYHGRRWTAEEIALLGKVPDAEVARKVNRTVAAVRQKREELQLPNPGRRPP